jgi:hypothetical protein
MRNAIMFAVYDCGFVPRCAMEEDNSGNVRFEKIKNLISISKFGIHDISLTKLDKKTGLPRFNMSFELGVFIGASRFGDKKQRNKNCLILDVEKYRYQKYISDIAGQDIYAHKNDPVEVIKCVRNWLNSVSGRKTIPGGSHILRRYRLFKKDLPNICKAASIKMKELTYNDFSLFMSDWLRERENA